MIRKEILQKILIAIYGRTNIKTKEIKNKKFIVVETGWYDQCSFSEKYYSHYLELFDVTFKQKHDYIIKNNKKKNSNEFFNNIQAINKAVKYLEDVGLKGIEWLNISSNAEDKEIANKGKNIYTIFVDYIFEILFLKDGTRTYKDTQEAFKNEDIEQLFNDTIEKIKKYIKSENPDKTEKKEICCLIEPLENSVNVNLAPLPKHIPFLKLKDNVEDDAYVGLCGEHLKICSIKSEKVDIVMPKEMNIGSQEYLDYIGVVVQDYYYKKFFSEYYRYYKSAIEIMNYVIMNPDKYEEGSYYNCVNYLIENFYTITHFLDLNTLKNHCNVIEKVINNSSAEILNNEAFQILNQYFKKIGKKIKKLEKRALCFKKLTDCYYEEDL